jgi:hypothetical protein
MTHRLSLRGRGSELVAGGKRKIEAKRQTQQSAQQSRPLVGEFDCGPDAVRVWKR